MRKPTKPYWKVIAGHRRGTRSSPTRRSACRSAPLRFARASTIAASGADFTFDVPVQYRYEGAALEGEKRMELTVVPKLALRVTPEVAIDPAGRGTNPSAVEREIRVKVTNDDKGATAGQVHLDVPAGWRVTPPTAPSISRAKTKSRPCASWCGRRQRRLWGSTPSRRWPPRALSHSMTGFQVVEYPAHSAPPARDPGGR